jgi:hypothetical protein
MALTKVSSSLVSDNAITTGKLVDGGVHSADIADVAVTSAKIANNAILTQHIDDAQVTTDQLGADAVTAAKIADNAVSEEHVDITVITSLTAVTAATGDLLMVADVSDSNNLKKIPVSSILAGTHTGAVNTSGTINSGALGVTGNIAVSGTVDGIDIAARDAVLTSTTTTAGAALPKAGGTMTGSLLVDAGNNGLDIRLGTDKRVTWSGGIGEIGNTAGFQAINTAGSALAAFGIRASELKFATGSATRLTIDASGNVSLAGTYQGNPSLSVTPTATIDQRWSAGSAKSNLINAIVGVSNGFQTLQDTSNNIVYNFFHGANNGVTHFGAGKVGIGTNSPYTLLELSSTDPIIRMTDSNGVTDKSIYEMRAIGAAGYESLEFRSVNDANNSYNKLLVLKYGGNVGIGTDTPQRKLTVVGAADSASDNTGIIQLNVGTGANTDAKMTFGIMSSHAGYIHVVKPGSDVYPLILNPTGSANGRVGIGHTAPVARLHLKGTGSYNHTPANPQGADFLITSSEMGDNNYHSIMQLVSVRQSLSTGSGANGYLGFSTIDDSNNVGINDAARIAVYNEGGTSNTSPTALSFWTNSGSGGSTGVATERMRITSVGDILIGNTTVQPSSNHNNQAGFGYDVSTSQLQIASTTNNAPMELSRNSANDGNWMTFRKQGNIYGNIGTLGGTLYIGSVSGGLMFNGTDIEPTTGGTGRANDTVSIGSSTYKFKDLYLSGSTNIAGNIDLAGSINAVGIVKANHMLISDAGHNTARIEAIYDDQSAVATKGNMLMWVSEPGITYDAGGIGTNVHSSGHYYGRKYDNGYSVFQRFEKQTGNIVFYNNQGTSGTAGASQTEMLRIEQAGNLRLAASAGIGFGSTAAAHTLDDYEEGSYDAAITCASGSITLYGSYNRLSYVKIGSVVHVQGKLAVQTQSSPTGATTINLPFAIPNRTDSAGTATQYMSGYFNGSSLTTGVYGIHTEMGEGSSVARLFVHIGTATNNLGDGYVGTGTDLWINLTYQTD